MKPVGQQHEKIENGQLVDKDVILFKEYFHLTHPYETMSPLIFPPGFTRDFLDGRVQKEKLEKKITSCFVQLSTENDFTIVEGTGHVGVGSVVGLNNAKVASLFGLEMVIIAKGGIGSSFVEMTLNKALCDAHNVPIRGVILNRVYDEKRDMIVDYMTKALKPLNIPLIGAIPYSKYLSTPSMEDFELLFRTKLISGEEYHYRHFESIRLVATSVETFKELTVPGQLIVTPASREDIVHSLLAKVEKQSPEDTKAHYGLILTGRTLPTRTLLEQLKRSKVPALYAATSTFTAMQMITSFIAKTRKEDVKKVKKAIDLVENHLNFDLLTN